MASSRTMPHPLSVIWISFLPPASTLILMRVAPGSREFSRISLTPEAGRFTDSLEAVWLATVSESTWMRPMGSSRFSVLSTQYSVLSTQFPDSRIIVSFADGRTGRQRGGSIGGEKRTSEAKAGIFHGLLQHE